MARPAVAPAQAGPPSAGRGGSARGKSADRAWARPGCAALRAAALPAPPASPDEARLISRPGRDAVAPPGEPSAAPPRAVPGRPEPRRCDLPPEPGNAAPVVRMAAGRRASAAPPPALLQASARAGRIESGQAGARWQRPESVSPAAPALFQGRLPKPVARRAVQPPEPRAALARPVWALRAPVGPAPPSVDGSAFQSPTEGEPAPRRRPGVLHRPALAHLSVLLFLPRLRARPHRGASSPPPARLPPLAPPIPLPPRAPGPEHRGPTTGAA